MTGKRVQPTAMQDYLFDLRGFLVLRNAIAPEQLAAMNGWIDDRPSTGPGDWIGNVHHQVHEPKLGLNFQQIYEAEPFRCLIDHPSWIELVKRYVGGQAGYDAHFGPVFIDENFINVRGPGEAISLHSGGHDRVMRTQFRYHDGDFHCGQINILFALQDIGPGDGTTMVIPGSHKSNLRHPQYETSVYGADSVEAIEGAIQVHLNAGDAILFVDAIAHGSAERRNPGERRIGVFRYGPSWGNFRYGYEPSEELLAALNEEQRRMVRPIPPLRKP